MEPDDVPTGGIVGKPSRDCSRDETTGYGESVYGGAAASFANSSQTFRPTRSAIVSLFAELESLCSSVASDRLRDASGRRCSVTKGRLAGKESS